MTNGIERRKGVREGRPVIEGTSIEPAGVFDLFMGGLNVGEMRAKYPDLDEAQVQAAIRFCCAQACRCKECGWAKKLPLLERDSV